MRIRGCVMQRYLASFIPKFAVSNFCHLQANNLAVRQIPPSAATLWVRRKCLNSAAALFD